MNTLNKVPSQGTYGEAVKVLNSNFTLLRDAVSQLEYSIDKGRGLFSAATSLPPTGGDGEWAIVLGVNGFPATIYTWNGSSWTATEDTWEPDGELDVSAFPVIDVSSNDDLVLTDEDDYAIARFAGGHIRTKNFNSETTLGRIEAAEERIDEQERRGSESLPAYYLAGDPFNGDGYIDGKIEEINRIILNSGKNSDRLFFYTDPHFNLTKSHQTCNTGKLLAYMLQRVACRKVVCGGDCVWADNEDTANDNGDDYMAEAFGKYTQTFKEAAAHASHYMARGNHDWCLNSPKGSLAYSGVDLLQAKNLCSAAIDHSVHWASDYEVNDAADASMCNILRNRLSYYFDNGFRKIRYVVLDSTTGYSYGDNFNGGKVGVLAADRRWFAKLCLDTPSGYSIVVMSHIPGRAHSGSSSYNTYPLLQLIRAIQDRATFNFDDTDRDETLSDISFSDAFDFSAVGANIIAYIAGHTHTDLQMLDGGVLYLTTICDSTSRAFAKSPFYEDYANAGASEAERKGTTLEQCLDFINIDIDNDIVRTVRIGDGKNRVIHTRPVSLPWGGTATVTPETTLGEGVRVSVADNFHSYYNSELSQFDYSHLYVSGTPTTDTSNNTVTVECLTETEDRYYDMGCIACISDGITDEFFFFKITDIPN